MVVFFFLSSRPFVYTDRVVPIRVVSGHRAVRPRDTRLQLLRTTMSKMKTKWLKETKTNKKQRGKIIFSFFTFLFFSLCSQSSMFSTTIWFLSISSCVRRSHWEISKKIASIARPAFLFLSMVDRKIYNLPNWFTIDNLLLIVHNIHKTFLFFLSFFFFVVLFFCGKTLWEGMRGGQPKVGSQRWTRESKLFWIAIFIRLLHA